MEEREALLLDGAQRGVPVTPQLLGLAGDNEAAREAQEDARLAALRAQQERMEGQGVDAGNAHAYSVIEPARLPRRRLCHTSTGGRPPPRPPNWQPFTVRPASQADLAAAARRAAERTARWEARMRFVERVVDWETEPRRMQREWIQRRHQETDEEVQRREEDLEDSEVCIEGVPVLRTRACRSRWALRVVLSFVARDSFGDVAMYFASIPDLPFGICASCSTALHKRCRLLRPGNMLH